MTNSPSGTQRKPYITTELKINFFKLFIFPLHWRSYGALPGGGDARRNVVLVWTKPWRKTGCGSAFHHGGLDAERGSAMWKLKMSAASSLKPVQQKPRKSDYGERKRRRSSSVS